MDERAVVVYRVFSVTGDLLYIGQTKNLEKRMWDHRYLRPWADQIGHVETTRPTTRRAALRYERMAIRSEQPPGNYEHRADAHGTNARRVTCSCDECKRARRATLREFRSSRRARFRAGELEVVHGTLTAYTDLACRCGACRSANTEARRSQRQRRATKQEDT